MNDTAPHTIEQIEAFLTGTKTVGFRFENTAAGYARIQATLARLKRANGNPCQSSKAKLHVLRLSPPHGLLKIRGSIYASPLATC